MYASVGCDLCSSGGRRKDDFVCLLVFPLQWARLYEVVILFADDRVCVFVLFLVWARRPAVGAASSWVMPGIVYRWRPCGSSH